MRHILLSTSNPCLVGRKASRFFPRLRCSAAVARTLQRADQTCILMSCRSMLCLQVDHHHWWFSNLSATVRRAELVQKNESWVDPGNLAFIFHIIIPESHNCKQDEYELTMRHLICVYKRKVKSKNVKLIACTFKDLDPCRLTYCSS